MECKGSRAESVESFPLNCTKWNCTNNRRGAKWQSEIRRNKWQWGVK
jgi:hypothetical protein